VIPEQELTGTGLTQTFTMPAVPVSVSMQVIEYTSTVIDGFDYIPAGGTGGQWGGNAVLTALGFTFTGNEWWGGLYGDLPGQGTDQRPGAQSGGPGTLVIARTNENTTFAKTITPSAAKHPAISFGLYVRGPADNTAPDPFTFEVHTGTHSAANSQHVVWAAPAFTVTRTIPAINGPNNDTDTDGWITIMIPLSDFKNAGNPISGLSEIVITGWRIAATAGNCNMFLSEIAFIQDKDDEE
jgi:hypothetical protein